MSSRIQKRVLSLKEHNKELNRWIIDKKMINNIYYIYSRLMENLLQEKKEYSAFN